MIFLLTVTVVKFAAKPYPALLALSMLELCLIPVAIPPASNNYADITCSLRTVLYTVLTFQGAVLKSGLV